MQIDNYPTSLNRKKHQRWVNKQMRKLNKLIEQDELWLGRFVVRQSQGQFVRYPDRSGGYMWLTFEFIDKKTGTTIKFWEHSGFALFSDLAIRMNSFIINDCKVWQNEDPYNDEKLNYTKVRLKDVHKKYIGNY